jgi:carboxypeptidase Taq
MQDIHWAGGSIGYFPTYTLGAMIAAQLMDAANTQISGLQTAIEKGEFSILTNWLKENVHSKASRFSTQEIVLQATGKPLDAGIYKAHLKNRYLA